MIFLIVPVTSPQSSHSSYPLTGQQVMMQLDQMTSRMMEMVVTTEGTEQMETQHSENQNIQPQEHLQHNLGWVSPLLFSSHKIFEI